MNTHHPPVTLVRRSLTTLLAALLVLTHILPATAQPKPGQPAPASPHTPVVRYIGMTTGVVGAPFVLRARVRDAVTGAPLPGAPVVFTLGDLSFAASADASGVAEQVTQLTPALAGATVTARYGGQVAQAGDLLALATTDGGDAMSNATVTAAALTPASLVATLTPGQSVVENKLATLPAAAQTAGDIVFAFDTTASMGFSLPATQGLAEDIMAALTADGLDVRFGATAFQDYAGAFPAAFGYPATAYGAAGSYPHVRVQPLSADTTAVANAIYTLQAASSDDPGDPPGSYSRALYETVAELTPAGADPTAGALGYRADARRMVALFGDDLPHDNDLNQGVPNTSGVYSTGGDPGRDGVLQETSNPAAIGVGNDDLDWQGVLATMQSNGVALLSYDLNPFTTDYWSTWAAATGGEHLFDYDGIVAALRGRLQSQSTAASVTLRASAGFESWVSVQPVSYTNVALPASLPFSVTITPPPGTAPGLYTFRVELLNGARVEAWQSVAITVPGAANRAPTAVNDSFNVDEDSLDNALAVLANDSDLDGDSLTVTAVTQPANGVVTLVGGVVRYTPSANYNGADSFTYTISDGALTATATVAITVRPVNDAPTAVNDSFNVDEDSLDNALAVLANDSDPDNDSLTVTAVTQPANGSVTLVGGVVRYTPNPNYNGADSFTYTISDGALTATATAAITVRPVNDAPTAGDDAFQVDRNSADNMLDVLANDSDLDNDSLTLVAVSSPDQGSAVISGAAIRYTPPAGYVGVARFTYTVSDGVLTATATVEVTVRAFNRAPTATDDRFTVAEDSGASNLAVLTNDSDPDSDPLVIAAVTTPANGTATIAGDRVRYTPNADFNGADAFTYTVSDGGVSATARVTVTVTPVNDAPTAVNDSFSVDEDSLDNVLAVLANDSDPDGDSLTVTAVTQPANGVVTLVGGVVRYTPNPNYNGADSFTYTVSDGELTATATVAIHVQPAAGAPGVMLSLAIEGSGAAGDGVITVGQTVTVVATITNTGQSVLAVVPLRLAVAPAVLEMINASLTPDSINGGMHVWDDVTGVGTLAPGVRTEVRVVFRSIGPSRGLPGQVMTAAGIVQGATDAAGQTAPPANAVAQVRVTAPQVAIATRMVNPTGGELKANQVLTMSVRITNTGDTVITTLPLRDRFDGSVLSFVRASVSGGRVTGSGASAQVVWSDLTTALGDLAPGQSVEVLIAYRIKVVFWSSVRQSVVEGARDEYGDLLPAAMASTTIYCMKLELTMAAQPPAGSRVPRNAEIEYTLRLRTPGAAPLTNLVLRSNVTGDGAFYIEDVSDGVESALDHETTCPVRVGAPSHATQQTWVMDRLDAGASCVIVFKAKVAATRKAGYIEVGVEGMAAELLTPATVKVRHSVTTQSRADITTFAAASRTAEIEVFWGALAEEDVTGYHVWRSAHNELSTAERITPQPIAPDGGAQSFYAIVDVLADGADEAYYWLEVMRGAESEFVGPVWATPQVQATLYLPVTMNNSPR